MHQKAPSLQGFERVSRVRNRTGFRMVAPARKRRLQDAYAFLGFRLGATVRGVFGGL
jgi:hypothetical protein